MAKVLDVIKNINTIYSSSNGLSVLQDFERVLDNLNLYTYENWIDGELILGPTVERHWVECSFMWEIDNMPDPHGGSLLTDYGCSVTYQRDVFVSPKKIKKEEDIEDGTKKGKLIEEEIWVVNIRMPKKLMRDMFRGQNAITDEKIKEETSRSDSVEQPIQPEESEQPLEGVL